MHKPGIAGAVTFVAGSRLLGAIDHVAVHESTCGTKRTSRSRSAMSAFGWIADINGRQSDVRFWPKADIQPSRSHARGLTRNRPAP